MDRVYRSFTYKEANIRYVSRFPEIMEKTIRRSRNRLDEYISVNPIFRTSLVPVELIGSAPESARRMHEAALKTGTGPMAAVAGTMAQLAAEAVSEAGDDDIIVENGGDIFLISRYPVTLGLYAGSSRIGGTLSLRISPEMMPLAVCSSSGKMGHSLSLGNCDLATVISKDGALADAAATLACNLVKTQADIQPVLDYIRNIDGIQGIMIIKDDKAGLSGTLPEIVKTDDSGLKNKITRDRNG